MGVIQLLLKEEKGTYQVGKRKSNKYKVIRKSKGDCTSQTEKWQEFTRLAAKILVTNKVAGKRKEERR